MTLRAGTAVTDITPGESVPLLGYPDVRRDSTGVHDPLFASALHLRTPSGALIIVSLDLFGLDPPTCRAIRQAASDSTAIPIDRIHLSCSHTHSGPTTLEQISWGGQLGCDDPDPGYIDTVKKKVASVAASAAATSRPVFLGWTSMKMEGLSRHRFRKDGPIDPEAGIMCVRNEEGGRLMCVLIVFGAQPTTVGKHATEISADYPHYVRRRLREKFGNALAVLCCMGPCADQEAVHAIKEQPFDEADRVGTELADRIADSIGKMAADDLSRDITVSISKMTVKLPLREFPSLWDAQVRWGDMQAELERLHAGNARPEQLRVAECLTQGAGSTVVLARAIQGEKLEKLLSEYGPVEIYVLRIGNGMLACLPCEFSVAHGLEIRRRVGERIFAAGLVNGDLQGYILTPEAAEGEYGPRSTFWAPEAGSAIIQAVTSLAERV